MTLTLAFISSTMMTQLAVFGGVAVAMWCALEFFGNRGGGRAAERLEELSDPAGRRGERGASAGDKMGKILKQETAKLAAPLQPKTEEQQGKLKLRLAHGGFRTETAVSIFLGIKLICLILGFLIGGGAAVWTKGLTQEAMIITVASAGVMFFVPDAGLWIIKKGRQDQIFYGLPDALDLMVVCVEAGLGLDAAMRKVSEEMKNSYAVLANEFALCNLQLQMGSARNTVLHELGQRTGVDDLKALSAILIQADKFGSSVAQALRVQSDSMRTRRSQIAEEKAAKTAVKLIFPLVIFIFPAIFVVLVGPAAITMINEMFPAMSGGN
ncbi:Bacterial type II secretion system protein F domain protein [Pseudobythopirellula maris]|uniref:Bacterial type II secretion system protein F domain protein n=1 Tax=Pseudobythopirellula maris TaxID=2527991 RepID=A0A5C5ZUU7_9BACT|nr:type II secretion system F family protein [Pseudobythopirellula maris]TWT90671.1 Bacterial type II secretion system protein F domain protein [Pseudobythopirellula maris]